MKDNRRLYWKNGGRVSAVILFAIILLSIFAVHQVKPVLRSERISNTRKNVADLNLSFENHILMSTLSSIRTLAQQYELIDNPDSVYVLCKHLAECSHTIFGASVNLSGCFLPEGENGDIPTVIISGEKCTMCDVNPLEICDYSHWEALKSYFENNPDKSAYVGEILRSDFLDELAAPLIVPLFREVDTGEYYGYMILYISVSTIKSITDFSKLYSDGMIFFISPDSLFMVTSYDSLLHKPAYPWLRTAFGEEFVSSMTVPDVSGIINITQSRRYTAFVGYMPSGRRTVLYVLPTASLTSDLKQLWFEILMSGIVTLLVIVFVCYRTVVRNTSIAVTDQMNRKDMETASRIQKSMLSNPLSDMPFIDMDAVQIPAKLVGGDIYYFFERNGLLYFCIGDVSGKGLPAAMFMSRTVSLFRNITRYAVMADDIAEQLNQELIEDNDMNMFVTMFIGIFNSNTGELHFCNAGHDEPIFWSGIVSEPPEYLNTSFNLPLGIDSGIPFKAGEMNLKPGSVLMLYTDGVNEAMNDKSDQYGTERLIKLFGNVLNLSSWDMNAAFIDDIHSFVGGYEQSDDITILTLRVKPLDCSVSFTRNFDDLSKIKPFCDEIFKGLSFGEETRSRIRVALDEAVTNVVKHGFSDDSNVLTPSVSLRGYTENGLLTFVLRDNGIAFNPIDYLSRSMEDILNNDIMDVQIGGLGIPLIKMTFDSLSYERESNENVLTMSKIL